MTIKEFINSIFTWLSILALIISLGHVTGCSHIKTVGMIGNAACVGIEVECAGNYGKDCETLRKACLGASGAIVYTKDYVNNLARLAEIIRNPVKPVGE